MAVSNKVKQTSVELNACLADKQKGGRQVWRVLRGKARVEKYLLLNRNTKHGYARMWVAFTTAV